MLSKHLDLELLLQDKKLLLLSLTRFQLLHLIYLRVRAPPHTPTITLPQERRHMLLLLLLLLLGKLLFKLVVLQLLRNRLELCLLLSTSVRMCKRWLKETQCMYDGQSAPRTTALITDRSCRCCH